MKNHQILAEAAQQKLEMALAQGRHWVAYDSHADLLEASRIEIFTHKCQAIRYAALGDAESEDWAVFHAAGMKMVYGRFLIPDPDETIISPKIEQL